MHRFVLLVLLSSLPYFVDRAPQTIPPRVAILDFGSNPISQLTAEQLTNSLKKTTLSILDRDLSRSAARGAAYQGSLNLTLEIARDLGSALGCEYYILGDAQTLRRSSATAPIYFESYATIFVVSSRTGRLVSWERPHFEESSAVDAQNLLMRELASVELRNRLLISIMHAREEDAHERELVEGTGNPVIEEALADENRPDETGLRFPAAFQRLRPTYTTSAANADVEATVDVLADIDMKGDVTHVEVVRWAGFGLDESTSETVRRLKFFPATRDGRPLPIRVLLRYNFKKPPK